MMERCLEPGLRECAAMVDALGVVFQNLSTAKILPEDTEFWGLGLIAEGIAHRLNEISENGEG